MSRSGPRGPQQHPRESIPLAMRFWARVERAEPDECWLWMGARQRFGHGVLGIGRAGEGNILAHRLAWQLANGPIPEGLNVCHHCDNPSCVNPRHLYVGTQDENMRDARARGHTTRWERKLTDEDVARIRASTLTQTTLRHIFGVTQSTISLVQSSKRRRSVP